MLLGKSQILDALGQLGSQLARPTEILIVGGTAGLLTGEFDASHVTEDVDLIACRLPSDREVVFDTAEQVGHTLSLPASWLSDFSGLFRWTLQDDWRERAIHVGTFDRLTVLAVGRLDLLAMKFLSHRIKDREHLDMMKPSDDELAWVTERVGRLHDTYPTERGKIDMTLQLLANWNRAQ